MFGLQELISSQAMFQPNQKAEWALDSSPVLEREGVNLSALVCVCVCVCVCVSVSAEFWSAVPASFAQGLSDFPCERQLNKSL